MTIYRPNTAIPTRYHGYYFRSRLEARWAVVFETLGLDWRYEVEGWQSPSGTRWLPDFLINFQGKKTWVSLKPPGVDDGKLLFHMSEGMPEDEQIWSIAADIPDPIRLSRGIDYQTQMAGREPGSYICLSAELEGDFDMIWANREPGVTCGDINYYLCVCPDCEAVGLEFDGRSARIDCDCPKDGYDKNYTTAHPTLVNAYAVARAARFEHDDREVWSRRSITNNQHFSV